jgi:hypothetical protein
VVKNASAKEPAIMGNRDQAVPTAYHAAARTLPLSEDWDVIVVGGGPAGSAAATAAAREGARTLLLEANGALGGMGTLGLVPWFCGYTDGAQCIARGIAERVRLGLAEGMPHLKEWLARDPLCAPAIAPEVLKRIYDTLVTEAGATVLFHSQLVAVERAEDGTIDALLVANKQGLSACRAKVYVDCTGDGDLAVRAGAAYEKGDAEGHLQPATHCFVLTNVEPYRTWASPAPPNASPTVAAPSLHFFDPDSPVHRARASGRYPLIVDQHSCSMQIGPRTYGYNFGHIYGVDNTDPASVSAALIRGRAQAAQYRDAFAEFHPAFAQAMLVATGALLGVRETRRIVGDYVLTMADYLARRSFPDEICRNAYNIDVHGARKPQPDDDEARRLGETAAERSRRYEAEVKQLGRGESYGVPYRCLTPRGLANVLVAGRCISTDRSVNGSVRIMACCLTTGEAAGTAAALAAGAQGDVHAVPVPELRRRLVRHGAYLPGASA